MKINEIEAAVGITKKNIRFYEAEGLLHPRRNSENGYRDYCEEDVVRLRQIKLLRKLDVPLAEIKSMLEGRLPLAEGMRRHQIELAHRQASLQESLHFCQALTEQNGMLGALDAETFLQTLNTKEQQGVRFVTLQKKDTKTSRKRGAVVGAVLFLAMLLFWVGFVAWVMLIEEPVLSGAMLAVLLWLVGVSIACVVGVLIALRQRMNAIQKGEEDAYRNY